MEPGREKLLAGPALAKNQAGTVQGRKLGDPVDHIQKRGILADDDRQIMHIHILAENAIFLQNR